MLSNLLPESILSHTQTHPGTCIRKYIPTFSVAARLPNRVGCGGVVGLGKSFVGVFGSMLIMVVEYSSVHALSIHRSIQRKTPFK